MFFFHSQEKVFNICALRLIMLATHDTRTLKVQAQSSFKVKGA